jgi:hypothetical protein
MTKIRIEGRNDHALQALAQLLQQLRSWHGGERLALVTPDKDHCIVEIEPQQKEC